MAAQWFPICSRSIFDYLWVSMSIYKNQKVQCTCQASMWQKLLSYCCPYLAPCGAFLVQGPHREKWIAMEATRQSVFSGTTHVSNVWSQIEQYSPISTPRHWGAKQSESRLCHQCVHRYNCTPVWVCLRIALVPVPHYKPSSFLIVTITNSVLS